MGPIEKALADKIYAIGFSNGEQSMKNKVLKKINRDWSIVNMRTGMDVAVKIMKVVNTIKIRKVG